MANEIFLRYLAVMYPTTYRYKIREGKIGVLIFGVWAISIAIAIPMLFGDGYKETTHSCDLLRYKKVVVDTLEEIIFSPIKKKLIN